MNLQAISAHYRVFLLTEYMPNRSIQAKFWSDLKFELEICKGTKNPQNLLFRKPLPQAPSFNLPLACGMRKVGESMAARRAALS